MKRKLEISHSPSTSPNWQRNWTTAETILSSEKNAHWSAHTASPAGQFMIHKYTVLHCNRVLFVPGSYSTGKIVQRKSNLSKESLFKNKVPDSFKWWQYYSSWYQSNLKFYCSALKYAMSWGCTLYISPEIYGAEYPLQTASRVRAAILTRSRKISEWPKRIIMALTTLIAFPTV